MANGFYKPTSHAVGSQISSTTSSTPKYDDRGFKLNSTTPSYTGPGFSSNFTNAFSDNVGNATPPSGGNNNNSNNSSGTSSASSGANAYDYLSSLMGSYAAQRQAQLEAAYGRARDSINGGFSEASGLLQSNFGTARDALMSSYNNSLKSLQDDAAKSLREAYINRMMSNKNLNQQLSAAGLSGGATETTLASMLNNYGNARNNINTTLNNNIADLDATRDNNLANIIQSYQSNLAQLASQRASALANIEMAMASGMGDALDQQYSFQTSGGYMKALQEAMQNQAAFQATPTQAINDVTNISTQQAGIDNISNSTNYTRLLEQILEALSQGSKGV